MAAAIRATIAVLLLLGALWALWSDKPMLKAAWDTLSTVPLIARLLVSVIVLGLVVACVVLLVRILRYVHGVPDDLKRELLRVQDLSGEQELTIQRLRLERDNLQTANNDLSAWKEGKRGWELEHSNAKKTIAELRAKLAQKRSDTPDVVMIQLTVERDQLRSERDQLREASKTQTNQYRTERYRATFQQLSPLSSDDLRLVLAEMDKLAPSIEGSEKWAWEIAHWFDNHLRGLDGGEPNEYEKVLAPLVWAEGAVTMRNSKELFMEMLVVREDPRAALLAFYQRYNAVRALLLNLSSACNQCLPDMLDYPEFRTRDATFLAEFERTLRINQLAEMRRLRAIIDGGNGYPVALPDTCA